MVLLTCGSVRLLGRTAGWSLVSEKLYPSVNETFTLILLADVGFDGLVTGRVGAYVGLGVAVDPDPLVGSRCRWRKLLTETGNRKPVPVGDGLSVGEQDAGAFRGSQDYRPPGGVLVRQSLGVHDQ